MNIVVCIRRGADGEISPFDASAYEMALRIKGAEITLLSMGPEGTSELLLRLSRLGASRAVLLSDKAFAGADTLATAYALSEMLKKLAPDLVFCGRQTLIGDTAQVPPMIAAMLGADFSGGVMSIGKVSDGHIEVNGRDETAHTLTFPAVLAFEKCASPRLPSIRSRVGELSIISASELGCDPERTGLKGSPTRVVESRENDTGRRKCRFIQKEELFSVIEASLKKSDTGAEVHVESKNKLKRVLVFGGGCLEYAAGIGEKVISLPICDPSSVERLISENDPDAVLFPATQDGRTLASTVAANMNLGLCADCTALSTDGKELYMIRPARGGSVMAKIKSLTRPAMATVRVTSEKISDIAVGIGFGARGSIDKAKALAKKLGAEITASRKAVDSDLLPYSCQVGLTGKNISPKVYIAVGISGAVHHTVGIRRVGTVIAVNPDKSAPIFDFADYGILENIESFEL